MAASTPSWKSSTKRTRTGRPRPERDGSTISGSGGQGSGVVWVATFQTGGGSHRWRTKWLTHLTNTTPFSQRAKSSSLWSRLCPETRIGSGLARILRILFGKAPCGAGLSCPRLARRVVAPHRRGRKWRERPPLFGRWCATGEGKGGQGSGHPLPPLRGGRSHHSDPYGKVVRQARAAGHDGSCYRRPASAMQPGLDRIFR